MRNYVTILLAFWSQVRALPFEPIQESTEVPPQIKSDIHKTVPKLSHNEKQQFFRSLHGDTSQRYLDVNNSSDVTEPAYIVKDKDNKSYRIKLKKKVRVGSTKNVDADEKGTSQRISTSSKDVLPIRRVPLNYHANMITSTSEKSSGRNSYKMAKERSNTNQQSKKFNPKHKIRITTHRTTYTTRRKTHNKYNNEQDDNPNVAKDQPELIQDITEALNVKPKDYWLIANKSLGLDIYKTEDLDKFKNVYQNFLERIENGNDNTTFKDWIENNPVNVKQSDQNVLNILEPNVEQLEESTRKDLDKQKNKNEDVLDIIKTGIENTTSENMVENHSMNIQQSGQNVVNVTEINEKEIEDLSTPEVTKHEITEIDLPKESDGNSNEIFYNGTELYESNLENTDDLTPSADKVTENFNVNDSNSNSDFDVNTNTLRVSSAENDYTSNISSLVDLYNTTNDIDVKATDENITKEDRSQHETGYDIVDDVKLSEGEKSNTLRKGGHSPNVEKLIKIFSSEPKSQTTMSIKLKTKPQKIYYKKMMNRGGWDKNEAALLNIVPLSSDNFGFNENLHDPFIMRQLSDNTSAITDVTPDHESEEDETQNSYIDNINIPSQNVTENASDAYTTKSNYKNKTTTTTEQTKSKYETITTPKALNNDNNIINLVLVDYKPPKNINVVNPEYENQLEDIKKYEPVTEIDIKSKSKHKILPQNNRWGQDIKVTPYDETHLNPSSWNDVKKFLSKPYSSEESRWPTHLDTTLQSHKYYSLEQFLYPIFKFQNPLTGSDKFKNHLNLRSSSDVNELGDIYSPFSKDKLPDYHIYINDILNRGNDLSSFKNMRYYPKIGRREENEIGPNSDKDSIERYNEKQAADYMYYRNGLSHIPSKEELLTLTKTAELNIKALIDIPMNVISIFQKVTEDVLKTTLSRIHNYLKALGYPRNIITSIYNRINSEVAKQFNKSNSKCLSEDLNMFLDVLKDKVTSKKKDKLVSSKR